MLFNWSNKYAVKGHFKLVPHKSNTINNFCCCYGVKFYAILLCANKSDVNTETAILQFV